MMSINEFVFCLFVFTLRLDSVASACNPSVYTWPLGEGILSYEINNQSWTGSHHNIGYNDGPLELNYSAIQFNASDQSYIEFPVQNTSLLMYNYAITVHLYVESDGVFMHYKSDDYGSNGGHVESIKFAIFNGVVSVTIYSSLYGETRGNFTSVVLYNTWLKFVFSRHRSGHETEIELTTDIIGSIDRHYVDLWLGGLWTSLPGTLRIGGSMDGDSYFSGRATCVNVMPCVHPHTNSLVSAPCDQSLWPTLTTPPQITTTMMMPTSQPPISTTATPKIQTTNPFIQTSRPVKQYRVVAANTGFADGEALDVVAIVPNQLACSRKCSAHVGCWTFVFLPGGGCWLGPRFPETKSVVGALLYELF